MRSQRERKRKGASAKCMFRHFLVGESIFLGILSLFPGILLFVNFYVREGDELTEAP